VCAGLLAAGAAYARVSRSVVARDSGRVVSEISISDRGIHVDAHGVDTSVAAGRVHIGPHGIVVEDAGSGLVRVFSDVRVGKGERVEGDVVAVFGSAYVDGEVSGTVVAVMGGVRLGPHAVVDGDAVSIGGSLEREPGAQIQGDSVSMAFVPLFTWGLPALPLIAISLVLGWALTLFVGWLLTLLFPENFARVAATVSRRSGASLLLGLASGPLFALANLLLFITLIGIPIALMLPLFFVLAIYMGQLAATYVLGCKLTFQRHRPEAGKGLMLGITLGSAFVLLFFLVATVLAVFPGPGRVAALFFAALGVLLLCGLSAIGTGAVLLSRGGTRAPAGTSGSEGAALEQAPIPAGPAPSTASS
jgi:hypothetical protein